MRRTNAANLERHDKARNKVQAALEILETQQFGYISHRDIARYACMSPSTVRKIMKERSHDDVRISRTSL